MARKLTEYYVGMSGLTGAKLAALARDGYRCRYCGVQMRRSRNRDRGGADQTVDHVIPLSQGGRDTLVNLVACCASCNQRKGNRTLREASMRMLPRPVFDDKVFQQWRYKAMRKCCVHCGVSGRFHDRDSSKPHGEQVRCKDTGKRFLPRDCPPSTYLKMGIEFPDPVDNSSTDVVY